MSSLSSMWTLSTLGYRQTRARDEGSGPEIASETHGVRRSELAGIQVRDFDAHRCTHRVYGKGRKERVLPLRGPVLAELRLFLSTDLPHVRRPPEPDDFSALPDEEGLRRPRRGRSTDARRPGVPEETSE